MEQQGQRADAAFVSIFSSPHSRTIALWKFYSPWLCHSSSRCPFLTGLSVHCRRLLGSFLSPSTPSTFAISPRLGENAGFSVTWLPHFQRAVTPFQIRVNSSPFTPPTPGLSHLWSLSCSSLYSDAVFHLSILWPHPPPTPVFYGENIHDTIILFLPPSPPHSLFLSHPNTQHSDLLYFFFFNSIFFFCLLPVSFFETILSVCQLSAQ